MALLDRPLFGENATGTLARALAFRRTINPEDLPGETVISWGTVTKIPVMSCRPSSNQTLQHSRYAAAVSSWLSLSQGERDFYIDNKPANLSGFNLFVRLYLSPTWYYFGYCIFGSAIFQLTTSPDQPAPADYDINFPGALDELPVVHDGSHSPQAWLFNRAYSIMISIESYLILHKTSIEGG